MAACTTGALPEADANPCVIRAELDGVVSSAVAEYLEDTLRAAERDCDALLVTVDTPGGDLASTRRIVKAFLSSEVPVIAYVTPRGARAGSAGMFIVLSAHVAAMAPSTTIGAAHPVLGTGEDPERRGGEHLGRKVENDAAAFARGIAGRHGRNTEWAEAAVRESVSVTASEALELDVIDLVSGSEKELLEAIEGRRVQVSGETATVALSGAEVRPVEMSLSQSVRSVLGHPTAIYILLIVGILGILLELSSPGLLIPGLAGGASLILAAIGIDVIPVNIGALVLLALAAGLFIAEVYVTSYGLLALAGVIALVLGSALLIDRSDPGFFADPAVDVSWGLIVPVAATVASAAGLLAWHAVKSQHRPSVTGPEAMIGLRAEAMTDIDPTGGHVRVSGERWTAVSSSEIPAGTDVRVVGLDDLRLEVEPVRSPTLHERKSS